MKEILFSGFADEAADDVAEQMDILEKNGVYRIEVRHVFGKNIVQCSDNELRELRSMLDVRGFSVSAIGSPIGKVDIGADFETETERMKRAVNAALMLGTEYIRAFSFYIPKGESADKFDAEVLERLNILTGIACENGVVYALENEVGLYGDNLARCLRIADNIKDMRIVFDPGNFIFSGTNPYPDAYEALKEKIAYFHIKDAVSGYHFVPCGEGQANMKSLMSAAYANGFDGFLSIEPHLKYIEGLSDAQRFTKACNALKMTLNAALGTKFECIALNEG